MIDEATAPRLYAGHDQPTPAMTTADGQTYYCMVYLDRGKWRIEAVCHVQQPDGRVVVFQNVVYQMSQDDIDAARVIECPKIIGRDGVFIVHFIRQFATDGSGNRLIRLDRYTMDMTAFDEDTWTSQTSVDLYHFGLYDVSPVEASDTDYIVAYASSDDQIEVNRHDGLAWVDTAWTTTIDSTALGVVTFLIQPHVLACYGSDTDDDVLVVVQEDNEVPPSGFGDLLGIHLDASDGGSPAVATAMDQFPTGVYCNAGMCRYASGEVVLVSECQTFGVGTGDAPINYIHHVGCARVNSGTGALVVQQGTSNVTLHSLPWAFPSGRAIAGTDQDVYAVLGYKSVTATFDWQQAYLYVCNLDVALWGANHGPADADEDGGWNLVTATSLGVRARPISTIYTVGIPDARPSGASSFAVVTHLRGPCRPVNHLSAVAGAPPDGPDCKTRTVAIGIWAQLQQQRTTNDETELQPTNAGAAMLQVHMEDPWTIFRDGAEQPLENFRGAYSRAAGQAVEIGRSLFYAGGSPYIYDGRQVTECGYFYQPEIFDAQAQAFDASGLSAGVYQAYVVWTRRDNAGQLHRSAPSNIFTITVAGDEDIVVLRTRPYALGLHDAAAHSSLSDAYQIEVFRTEADGSTFYREYGAALPTSGTNTADFRPRDTPLNNPNAPYIDVPFGVPDSVVVLQGLGPYQYGAVPADGLVGVIPMTPPAMTCCASWLNRGWGADALDPSIIRYTDEILPDVGSTYYQGMIWNAEQFFRIGEYGDVTGMQPMNNAMIVFTARGFILSLTAQPAGTTEQPGLMAITSEVLHEGLVCVDPRSLVLYPHGIGFQTPKGYFLLARSREAGYGTLARSRDAPQSTAGAAIEDDIREAGNVRSGANLESRHQIRLAANGRPVTTWTTTLSVSSPENGDYEFAVADLAPFVVPGTDAQTPAEIEAALEAVIQAAIDDRTLVRWISDVGIVGGVVVVTWVADVEPSYTTDAPPGATLAGVDTSTITTQPRVLFYDTLFQQWSRAELPQTANETRMAEVVAGCTWHGGRGEDLHVVLTQGALLVERPQGDVLEFADETQFGPIGVPLDLTWSWIHLAGMAGYTRTWEIVVNTERIDQAAIAAVLEVDRDGSFDGIAITPARYDWPQSGQTTPPADLRVKPRVQLGRSFRLRVFEELPLAIEENVAIDGLTFHVGVQPGPARVRSTFRGTAT